MCSDYRLFSLPHQGEKLFKSLPVTFQASWLWSLLLTRVIDETTEWELFIEALWGHLSVHKIEYLLLNS